MTSEERDKIRVTLASLILEKEKLSKEIVALNSSINEIKHVLYEVQLENPSLVVIGEDSYVLQIKYISRSELDVIIKKLVK
jgi:hypothetical protein